jgi:hypothetical protein
MAAGKFTLYTTAKLYLPTGQIDMDTDTLVMTLHTGYTPSAAHSTWADVKATEITGDGYSAGGQSIGSATVGTANGIGYMAFSSVTWANSTLSARHAVVTRKGGASLVDADRIVGYIDLTGGANMTSTNGNFTVSFGGPAWATGATIATGDAVTANGNTYRASVGGQTAASGTGPTGTAAAITDNTVTWMYIGPAGVILTAG